ncbi:MAG: hypothetical protein HY050_08265 [Actinobacteria bacterium]|nr:hypothetical protein [Actinomycetota bacterium]
MTNSSFNIGDFRYSENQKLGVLARATIRRTGATQAAALRDDTGRTYVARNITTANFIADALEAVFTVAMASQIDTIEAIVLAGQGPINVKPAREYTPACLIWVVNEDGELESL